MSEIKSLMCVRMTVQDGPPLSGLTVWTRPRDVPLRRFLGTETGSAAVLLAATLVALVWTNVDRSSYDSVWRTRLSIDVGGWGVSQELRLWVNNGLMTFFFFVVGLEARRELDIGELRQRSRIVLPILAGIAAIVAPVAIYLALNSGRSSAHGWGVAMSTDTAFALGLLALVGPPFGEIRLARAATPEAVALAPGGTTTLTASANEDVGPTPFRAAGPPAPRPVALVAAAQEAVRLDCLLAVAGQGLLWHRDAERRLFEPRSAEGEDEEGRSAGDAAEVGAVDVLRHAAGSRIHRRAARRRRHGILS
jgi:hypothetical protein